jgi:mRNA interferase RelE/StbE
VAYRLELSPRARRDLKKLPPQVRERLKRPIEALVHTPRPPRAVKLGGEEDTYRIRVGSYRVLYEVHDRILLVVLLKVADRKEAYR